MRHPTELVRALHGSICGETMTNELARPHSITIPLSAEEHAHERLLDDARNLAERAARAGSPVQLEIWQGMHHVFQLDVADLRTSRIALDRAAEFLGEHLQASA